MAGYIRCSRLVKRAPFDDGDISPPAPIDVGPEKKKSKTSAILPLTALIISDSDEEFVCSIRPADVSFPHSKGSLFSSLLSTVSIVANDLDRNVSNNPDHPLPPQPHEYNYPLLHQQGNFPPQSYESYPPQQKNKINICSRNSQNFQNRYLNYRAQPNGSNDHNQQQGSNNFYSQFQGSSNNPMDRSASIPAEGNNSESNVPEGKEQGDWPL
jgi:hypothetical protein